MNQLRIITLIVIHFIYFQAQLRANVFLALEEQDAAKVSNLKLYILPRIFRDPLNLILLGWGRQRIPPPHDTNSEPKTTADCNLLIAE